MKKNLIVFIFLAGVLVLLPIGCSPRVVNTQEPTSIPTDMPTVIANTPVVQGGNCGTDLEKYDQPEIYQADLIADRDIDANISGASHYRMDVQLSDDYSVLNGCENILYTNQEDEALSEIIFRLYPNVTGGKSTVTGIQVNGTTVEGVLQEANSTLAVPLSEELKPGEQVSLDISFSVEIAREMGGNYGLFGYFNDVLVLDEFYPMIPVFDQNGWSRAVPPPNGDLTYNDISYYIVRVTAPQKLVMASTGKEYERQEKDGKQVTVFAAGPVRDFYLAGSEKYIQVSKTLGETTIHAFATPEQKQRAELAARYALEAMKSFNQRFGVYPYTELDLISSPMQALGIEYPGITGISRDFFDPNTNEMYGAPIEVMLESTTAHEIGHQWFYNIVGNDQANEPWVDEAVTQYVTYLYYLDSEGQAGADGFGSSFESRWARVNNEDIPIGLTSGLYGAKEYGAIVYGRGPLFFVHMAQEKGQDIMDSALKEYVQQNWWKIGTGQNLRQVLEEKCGCDLSTDFAEWVYPK